jgi:TolA-binding protein
LERSLANPKELPADYFARLASAAQSRALEIEQWAGASNPSEKIRRSQQVAELLLKAGEAELAHSRLLAQSRDATYVQAFWSALDLLNRAGNKRAATDAMELLVAEHSDDAIVPEVLLRLGQSYQDAAQPEKAIAAYRQLQTKYSSSASAARSAVLLAQAQIARGPAGYAAAQDVLTQFLHSNMSGKAGSPEHRRAALELGQLLYRMDRFEEAIASLTEQVEAFPNGERAAEAMFTAADSYRKSALKIEAKVASSQATSGSTELTQAVANKKQRLATARTMYDRLVEFYSKARPSADVQKQQERLSHFYRADCAFELANYEEAIKLYDAAAARYEQEPAALAAYVQIVNSYCALGKMEEARTANEKAKLLLRRLPAEAFNDGGFTMPKDYWEQWLKWTTTAGAW